MKIIKMCGILFALNTKRDDFGKRLATLKPRGPDEHNLVIGKDFISGHTRNCIVNPLSGSQPIVDDEWVVLHNGEIYNGVNITRDEHNENVIESTESDSYFILDLLRRKNPINVPSFLDGVFAYCAYNKTKKILYVARDPVGVIPLYMVRNGDECWVSNELKAILDIGEPEVCHPGHIYSIHSDNSFTMSRYVKQYPSKPPTVNYESSKIYEILEQAVNKRVYSDVPWGVLLSGGLDSSIVCALAIENEYLSKAYEKIHTFSIGLKGSEDVKRATEFAKFWNTVHHNVEFTPEEGFAAIEDVIYAIESYDVTTVRASVPMYLLGKAMKKYGIKMVLSGEGSDELFGGYLYNHKCPSAEEMHHESIVKMDRLHYHDCLRANKSLACHGIECRVPFLDKKVINYAMFELAAKDKLSHTHPEGKKMEKWVLREDFSLLLNNNQSILHRQKEQFSDGVGSEWITHIKEKVEQKYSNDYFKRMQAKYVYQTPQTKEALLYREIFNKFFSNCEKTVFYTDNTTACSSESAMKWDKSFVKDPSAQSLK
ncbi:MAG: asparagine synthase B [Dehalococcoidia bacterium]|nr:asparagine synthase B [Dehalococcoidia bacterium]